MVTERRVAKNTFYLLVGQVGQALSTLVLWLLIARMLEADAIGQYALAVSLSAIFANICKIGYEYLAVREVARDRELASFYLGDILSMKGGLALVGFLTLAATGLVVGYPADKLALLLVVGATTFLIALIGSLEWVFQAFERMEYQGGLRLFRGVAVLVLGALVLFAGGGILGVAVVRMVVVLSLFVLLYFIIIRRFARPEWRFDLAAFASMTKEALPFGLTIFATVLLFNADTVMLSHMKGDVVTGLYNLAYRLVDGLKLLPIAFGSALYPSLSHAFKNDPEGLKSLITKGWFLMAVAALPVAVGTTLLADRFVILFFGQRYVGAGPVLAILVWAGALLFLFTVINVTFAAIDKQPACAVLVFFGTIVNVLFNFLLIPRWGASGAALALVIGIGMMTVIGLVYLARHLSIPRWGSPLRYMSMGLATVVMGAAVWWMRSANLVVVTCGGAALYAAAILATRGLRWTDLQVLRRQASG